MQRLPSGPRSLWRFIPRCGMRRPRPGGGRFGRSTWRRSVDEPTDSGPTNWGRWGPDDERGTANLLTAGDGARSVRGAHLGARLQPRHRAEAGRAVRGQAHEPGAPDVLRRRRLRGARPRRLGHRRRLPLPRERRHDARRRALARLVGRHALQRLRLPRGALVRRRALRHREDRRPRRARAARRPDRRPRRRLGDRRRHRRLPRRARPRDAARRRDALPHRLDGGGARGRGGRPLVPGRRPGGGRLVRRARHRRRAAPTTRPSRRPARAACCRRCTAC